MVKSNEHIANINKSLKGIKSNISADYIWSDNRSIVITTNKVAVELDMKVIEKYIKNLNNIDVVATTHWNGTCDMLTSAKLLVGYLVVGITRELDKEPPLHCSFIYINTMWSVL